MLKQFKKFTRNMVVGANIATIIVMLLLGYSDRLNPVEHPMLSSAGLLFPALLLANLAFLLFWVIVHLKTVVVPIAGFLLCYFPVRTYTPINILKGEKPQDAIKVMTYNVQNFDVRYPGDDGTMVFPALDYVLASDADIVCMQEAYLSKEVRKKLLTTFPHVDTIANPGTGGSLPIASKFPIIRKERIQYNSRGNMSGAFFLNINGDTVIVVNNHFEISGLTIEDRNGFNEMMKGKTSRDTIRNESKRLIVKLGESARIRAPQAGTVAQYLRDHRPYSIILCGDFNDNPISYTHHTIAKELTDCYVESGNGPGWSYARGAMRVRIDNIMCSPDWVPYGCTVDSKINASDHYPVACWLKKGVK